MFSTFKRLLATTAIGITLIASQGQAQAAEATSALTPEQTKAVQALIHKTLVENPEIIAEAMAALKAKQAADLENAQKEAIRANQALLTDANDPYMGADKPKYHVVEFFDYNCGYCRAALPDIQKIVDTEKDTRIVIKELPVLGPDSDAVSRLALASREQGKYKDYHIAMMSSRARLDAAAALKIAKDLGMDIERLKKDAQSDAVEAAIIKNHTLANALGIRGTPAFIVGDTLFPGRVNASTLSNALKALRDKE